MGSQIASGGFGKKTMDMDFSRGSAKAPLTNTL